MMKILIAEDEPSLRENLQWMLEMEGYAVLATCDGREAFAKACESLPDLVITDVMMPHLDGYGLVKALREQESTATTPIIMLSAKADRGDIRAGMNLGADDYITKPYRREELLAAISSRLARKASLDEAATRLRTAASQGQQYDALTTLPGKEQFDKRLVAALEGCSGTSNVVSVVCLGLDGFSKINDSLGKTVGDGVLREAAKRLFEHLGQFDASLNVVARLGGDTFAACLTGAHDQKALEGAATELLTLLAMPYLVEGNSLFLTACAGASIYPLHTDTAHTLLLNAESALHHAKSCAPGTYWLFDAAMNRQVARRLQLHNALHLALEHDELQVFYQPQVRIETGALVGFEALLRWQHPTLGWISPAEFIPVAEESGIIIKIGEWVMRTAAAQAVAWLALGYSGFRMAVNLSVRQFAGNKLPALVRQVLQDTGLPAQVLELEVTESLALQSVASTLGTLHECKSLGVKLAMDDFGTGYSSLSYLKRYPLNALKIDQSFVRNITQDAGDAAITQAIVAMAHSFGMSVIAEGVETTEQLEFLRTLGCEEFQGYLFSRPVPALEAVKCFSGYQGRVDPL
ncbi:MAG: EAL domain-containing protein [Burkholderiales bacterium]